MTLTQNRKLFQIIIGVSALIILVLFFSIFTVLKQNEEESSQQIAPNKIVPPQKNVELREDTLTLKNKLILSPIERKGGDLLIYKSEDYYIEYITTPDVFFVKIDRNALQSKLAAQNWFIDQGFKQEDLCTISVRFVLTNLEVRKEDPNFTSLPDGCTGQTLSKP